MLDLYAWPTPNGYKISIFLEEAGLPYNVIPVDIGAGDQFKSDFLKISPNNKMPAIVDPEGPDGKPISIFESGAILLYLAEKTGKFWPADMRKRVDMLQWLMFQMGGFGPMLGQAHHFRMYAPEKIEYGINRYTNEAKRLYGVLDTKLGQTEYVAGDYGLADMAIFPWTRSYANQGIAIEDYPHVKRWADALNARPAVQRGLELLKERRRQPGQQIDEKARENMFGNAQYARR